MSVSPEAAEIANAFQSEAMVLKPSVLGSACTTYAIGGPLEALFEPNSQEELVRGLRILLQFGASYKVLGNGSNLLIRDEGVKGVVVRLGRGFRTIEESSGGRVSVGGSYSLMALSRELSERGLSGLEFAGGIPASLGGALRMNAGAHGGEVGDLVEQIEVVLPGGELEVLSKQSLKFSYRSSTLPDSAIVTRVTLKLSPGDKGAISEKRAHLLSERKKTQPLTVPSAGSVFKNPSREQSAGFLIERVGLKGAVHGGAQISSMHGNWIINPNRKGRFDDVTALVSLCREKVLERYGIFLHQEIIQW